MYMCGGIVSMCMICGWRWFGICSNMCVMSGSGRFVVCICVYGRYMMCGGGGWVCGGDVW